VSDLLPAISLFVEGDHLYDAMLADIAGAGADVRLECYMVADDEVGGPVLSAFADAARAGRRVQVRIDAIGSWRMISPARVRALVEAGVRWHWSRPWSWRRPWQFHVRNHRKLLVVDDAIAYVGGFNIDRRNSQRTVGQARWRDTHVRLTGSHVAEAIAHFDAYPKTPRRPAVADRMPLALLSNRSLRCRHRLKCAFTEAFDQARTRLWLTTPYFVPDRRSQQSLCAAARRGVDVRLLVPGKSDVPLAQWAARAAYAHMLEAGVRIWEYQSRVLHAKTALVDGSWATVGTSNFDYRSFFLNDEINLLGQSSDLNATLAMQFHQDLAQSHEIERDAWKRRPWYAPILEWVGWWARRWL
jgi:cardiolipin synthase